MKPGRATSCSKRIALTGHPPRAATGRHGQPWLQNVPSLGHATSHKSYVTLLASCATHFVHPSPPQVPLNLTEGPWQLILRNDVFSKVRGSVVRSQELSNAAYYLRHYVALASVVAEMDFEEQLLQVRRRCTRL